jgi:hypothetical protein
MNNPSRPVSPGSDKTFRNSVLLLLGVFVVALVLFSVCVFLIEWHPKETHETVTPEEQAKARGMMGGGPVAAQAPPQIPMPFVKKGIDQPPTRSAAEAELPDDAEVIGISAGGKHRAYLVTAMSGPSGHVVNDLLGDVPVTVTHCDKTDCTRALTGPKRGSPLPLMLGGLFFDNQMLLKTDDGVYLQMTGEPKATIPVPPFPYSDFPFVRVTWGTWKEAHPDTDVFVSDTKP